MNRKLIIKGFLVITAVFAVCQKANADTCTFNNENPMKCDVSSSNVNGKFQLTITWEDGASDIYTMVGSNAERVNHIDSRGGRWHYYDHRNCRDADFINVDNGNIIRIIGDNAAC
jgi:hypothetical protein